MMSSRAIKRDAAPENAKPIKNATTAAVDARTRVICRSKGSSTERISEPNQKPSSWAATTPAIRPDATNISVICRPLDPPRHTLQVTSRLFVRITLDKDSAYSSGYLTSVLPAIKYLLGGGVKSNSRHGDWNGARSADTETRLSTASSKHFRILRPANQRQGKTKDRARPSMVLGPDVPTVGFDDGARDRQP